MKRISANLILSGVITTVLTIIDYLTASLINKPIFSLYVSGGDMVEYIGIGINLNIFYPETTMFDVQSIYEIEPNIITFILCFLVVFGVLMIIRAIRNRNSSKVTKKKAKKK